MRRIVALGSLFAVLVTAAACGRRGPPPLPAVAPSSTSTAGPEQPGVTISGAVAPSAAHASVARPACPRPTWLLRDLALAAGARFPIDADTYALNWDSVEYDNSSKPFNVFAETERLWIGGYSGRAMQKGYWYYSGIFDMPSYYRRVKAGTVACGAVTYVYVLESGDEKPGRLMPAMSLDLGNGQFLAFAPDQVVTKSEHAGTTQYVVYPVAGITAPY